MFIIEAIVIGLTIPVSINAGFSAKEVYLYVGGLMVMCILAAGAMRRDRATAVRVGIFVQVIICLKALSMPALMFPGLIFWAVLIYAIYASGKVDAAKSVK